jgi:demethylmenaquinone methyltransferase/2-methoxy-6-polyprenyl-1,4-benzoquinol methylase
MSTYVYMRILESAPRRYDLGIRLLSFGRVDAMYEAVATAATAGAPGARILEIGCGTGNLTARLLAHGAVVTAIDQDPEMLAVAREKLGDDARVTLREMAAVEIADRFPPQSFDAVAATLVLSEMEQDEQAYVLAAARRVLRPGGRLVVADEVEPPGLWGRLAHAALRWPVAVLTYVLTQTSTQAVRDLAARVRAAGFTIREERRLGGTGVGLVVAVPSDDARERDVVA